MSKISNQKKIFDRLALRFDNKIRSTVDDEELSSLDRFLKLTFSNSPLRHSQKYNRWLFEENSNNHRYIAWDGDDVVGTQYGISSTIKSAKSEFNVAYAIDLSVTEKWRMKGLGVALIKKLMDSHDLVIGLGISPAAQAMFAKLNWHNMGQVNCYIKPLTTKGFSNAQQKSNIRGAIIYPIAAWAIRLATRIKLRLSPNHTTKSLAQNPNYHDELRNLYSLSEATSTFSLKKSVEYFQWRYLKAPTTKPYDIRFIYRNNRVSSSLITKIGTWHEKNVLAICDYIGPKSDYPAIIKLAEELALSADVDAIIYQGINADFESALKASFFVKRPHGDLFMLYCNDNITDTNKVKQTQNWRITFSDADMDFMFFQS